jgi:NADH:ubiquinone oxidoreductase subunit K
MNRDRKYATVAGLLFIIGTVPGVLSLGLLGSLPTASDYLVKLSSNAGRVTLSAFFIFIMALACSGIAVAMYPVLKRYYPALALSSVCFRVIEG